MNSRVQIINGDLFDTNDGMILLPADKNGSVAGWVAENARSHQIPLPSAPFREIGDVEQVDLGPRGRWRMAMWAASVDRWASREEAIRRIAMQAAKVAYRQEMPWVSSPLLGSGAGGLDARTSARALVDGFIAVNAGAGPRLRLYVPDAQSAARLAEEYAEFQSVFISYGNPDRDFASRLNTALKARNIRTWFFPEDAIPGAKLHRTMSDGVAEHDRVVMICSNSSLERNGLLNELEEALAREAALGGGDVIIPIMVDDHILSWAPVRGDLARRMQQRVIADFRGSENDAALFDRQVERLVGALRKNG